MFGLFGYLPLALKRLRSRPLLFLLLVATTGLAIGFTGSIPLFAGAVSQRILQQEIDVRANTRGWPVFSVRVSAKPASQTPLGVVEASETEVWLGAMLRRAVGLPVRSSYTELQSPMYRLAPAAGNTTFQTQYLAGVKAVHVPGIDAHISVSEGVPYGQVADPQQLSVWVERSFAGSLGLEVGDQLELGDLYSASAQGIPVVVAGLWQAANPADRFWYRPPEAHFGNSLLVTPGQFDALISSRTPGRAALLFWYFVMDDGRMNLDRVDNYAGGLRLVAREVERRLPAGSMDLDPREDLIRGQRRKASLTLVLLSLSLPVLIIMISFLASLSSTQARYQAREFAIFVSRGATRWQVLALATFEALLIAALALLPGLTLALALAYALGFSTGFLSFSQQAASGASPRDPLHISFYGIDWRPIAAMVAVSLTVRVVATWRISRINLTALERQQARPAAVMTGARLLVIALVALVAGYAYQQMTVRGALGLSSIALLDPRNDPLLALAPTLFILSAPLVASELLVWLVRPADLAGRWLPWISGYLALSNLGRAGSQYRAPAYRLILCLTLGIFYASMAKSADIWLVDLLRHEYGADLAFKLSLPEQSPFAGFSQGGDDIDEIAMLPSDEYRSINGVLAAARLGDFEATIRSATKLSDFRLLAVERANFPQVAYFRRDYARTPLGELMNRLARTPNGILLPRATADQMAVQVGDTLQVRAHLYRDTWLPLDYQVVGLFDYLPTMYPGDPPTLVTDLAYLELNTPVVLPHTVWLKLAPGTDGAQVIEEIRRRHAVPKEVQDLAQALATESRRLERTGTFGVLTVCFVAGVALSVADLLVHSTYRLRERGLINAVLRALGVGRASIMRSAMLEDAVTVAYSLVLGIACGIAGAILYVPFYTLGKASGQPVPPLTPFIDWQRSHWMAAAVALALILAEVFVLVRLLRARIFEVLRMGTHV